MVELDDAIIARLESHGERFEILLDPVAMDEIKKGKEIDLSEYLAVEDVFKDAHKGTRPEKSKINEVFGTEDIIAIAKSLRANSKKIGLYFCSDIDLTSGRMTAVIYDTDENGRLNNRVWEGNPGYRSDNLAESAKILSEADAFLCKYGEDSIENLTAEIERLSARLKEKKQKLATVKKAVKKEAENK